MRWTNFSFLPVNQPKLEVITKFLKLPKNDNLARKGKNIVDLK